MKLKEGDIVRVTGDTYQTDHHLEPGTTGKVVRVNEYAEGDVCYVRTSLKGRLSERWVAEEDLEIARSEEEIRQEFLQLLTGSNIDT